jgi:hypothetical protein
MSLQGSLSKIAALVLLAVLLFGCQQSPTGGAVITQTPENVPKDVVVTSAPAAQEPAAAAPIPINRIPENVLPRPEPTVIIIPENRPSADPVAACISKCDSDCKTSATYSCTKPTGTDCKASCGAIIDPSACSTACSLRSARMCEPKFIEFCTAQCIGKCH